MKFIKSLFVIIFIIYISQSVQANDYYSNEYEWKRDCPSGYSEVDSNYFFKCECVSYVADEVNNVFASNNFSVVFNNYYLQSGADRWGYASTWKNVAEKAEIEVSNYAYPGAIAWWNYGHVAFVQRVNFIIDAEGNYKKSGIDVSEYNYDNAHDYGERSISVGDDVYPDYFIHILPKAIGWSKYLDLVEMWTISGKPFSNQGRPSLDSGARVLGWYDEAITDYPEEPIISNPYTKSTDIHITHCKIRPYKEGSWHEEVDVNMAPGQVYDIEMEVRVRNKSNYDLDNIDIDYLVVKDKKDFNPDKRFRLEDEDVDIREGSKESKHSGRIRISISADLKTITVAGKHSFSFPITEQNRREKEITLYFYTDIETEDGDDRDVSDENKSDERGKLEIHLNLPEPPPAVLNLIVPYEQEYIHDQTKRVFINQDFEIPVKIEKSGLANLTNYPEVSFVLSGPEFENPQKLNLLWADYANLNSNGEDILNVKFDAISTVGDYRLEICVDSSGYITETNENDNFNFIDFKSIIQSLLSGGHTYDIMSHHPQ